MNIVKKVISITSLTALIATFGLNAQTPQGEVNAQGQLVLPGMDPIDPPAGEVDAEGNLVINGTTIPKPDATINADGSLTVGSDTFQVPEIPLTALLDLFPFGGLAYYHDMIGTIWIAEEGSSWVFLNNFSALSGGSGWVWIAKSVASDTTMWVYSAHFDDWVYFAHDSVVPGGLKSIFGQESEGDFQNGFIYLSSESDWRFYFEDAAGGYLNVDGADLWVQTVNK